MSRPKKEQRDAEDVALDALDALDDGQYKLVWKIMGRRLRAIEPAVNEVIERRVGRPRKPKVEPGKEVA